MVQLEAVVSSPVMGAGMRKKNALLSALSGLGDNAFISIISTGITSGWTLRAEVRTHRESSNESRALGRLGQLGIHSRALGILFNCLSPSVSSLPRHVLAAWPAMGWNEMADEDGGGGGGGW